MILWISQILIPFMVCYITGFGLLSGRPVFDDFLEGAKSGMKTAAGLLPVRKVRAFLPYHFLR